MRRNAALFVAAAALVLTAGVPAEAIHWYRGPGSGCTPADGELTGDAPETLQNVTATVVVGHNAFSEGVAGTGFSHEGPAETRIKAGESIRWTWNSAHCHSVETDVVDEDGNRVFESGYHYPVTAPDSPNAVPGFFDYPVLTDDPTLSYVRTFPEPGTFSYYCVHHASIGMLGVVIVEDE